MKFCSVFAACVALCTAPALAQEVTISGNVALATDYTFRGVSQTDESPAVQGGLDLTAGSFYLGTCASNQQAFDGPSNLFRCDLRLMGREVATGLITLNRPVYIWGVQYLNGNVFASDMLSGIWKLAAAR